MTGSPKSVTEKVPRRPLLVVAALILQQDPGNLKVAASNSVLVVQRPKTAKFGAGQWEFPGGKVEFGESPEESLIREIFEELKINIDVSDILCAGSHVDAESGQHIVLLCYFCNLETSGADIIDKLEKSKIEAADARWLPLSEIPSLIDGHAVVGLRLQDFAAGDLHPLRKLLAHLK